jgi:hypothetical protein
VIVLGRLLVRLSREAGSAQTNVQLRGFVQSSTGPCYRKAVWGLQHGGSGARDFLTCDLKYRSIDDAIVSRTVLDIGSIVQRAVDVNDFVLSCCGFTAVRYKKKPSRTGHC